MERMGFSAGHLQTRGPIYHVQTQRSQTPQHISFVNSVCFVIRERGASMEKVIRAAFLDDSSYTQFAHHIDDIHITPLHTYPIPLLDAAALV